MCFRFQWKVLYSCMPHFAVSEADQLVKVGDVALNPNVVYPTGGNVVDNKTYIATLLDNLLAHWRQFSVCGFPDFPAFLLPFDGIFCTVAMPRTVHLGSYLCQSEHPPNVILLTIVEDSDSRAPLRYRWTSFLRLGSSFHLERYCMQTSLRF